MRRRTKRFLVPAAALAALSLALLGSGASASGNDAVSDEAPCSSVASPGEVSASIDTPAPRVAVAGAEPPLTSPSPDWPLANPSLIAHVELADNFLWDLE